MAARPSVDVPGNDGLLRYLRADAPASAPTGPVAAGVDRWRLGTHPDIVDYLWDRLAVALPRGACWLVAGTPALVLPSSGVVVAVGLGTEYALRLPPAEHAAALAAGGKLVHEYRGAGATLDLRDVGPDWVFGCWDAREPEWLATAGAGER
jgi:hypothetical protein